eukprot:s1634_g9.t3
MWKALVLAGLACVLAEEGQDGSCMLQAQAHGAHKDKVAMVEAKQMKAELKHALHQKSWNKGFCGGEPLTEFNFNGFSHGTEIKPDSVKGMTITATRRATEPEPGFGKPCPGPLLILDTREEFRSVDKDLQRCKDCTIAVWSKDGNRRKVNDCGEHPGVLITITFKKLQSLDEVELWDLEEPTFVELYGTKNRLLKNISAPDGPGQDGNPAILKLLTTHVRTMKMYLGGSGGLRRFTACRGGSVWGDPHIYTLDGEKFDLYESGTYTVFQHGHSLSLLEDEEYVTSFEYVNEKKIMLRMNGERGKKDTIVLNTVCKPSGINLRVSMPNMDDSQFLEGQIQVGNGGKHTKKFQTNMAWVKLGGTAEAADFLDHLETKQTFLEGHGHGSEASCDEAERAKAEKLCQKHLGGEMREADGINAEIFEDCVSDVCQVAPPAKTRDALFLGIGRQHDHNRYMKSVKVIFDEDGLQTISPPEKDKDHIRENILELRKTLHRFAYQHKTVKKLEQHMIDILILFNKHATVTGTKNRQMTIAEAALEVDLVAYPKLTDMLVETRLLEAEEEGLKEACQLYQKTFIQRKLMRNVLIWWLPPAEEVVQRLPTAQQFLREMWELYDQSGPSRPSKDFARDEVRCVDAKLHYGMKQVDPIKKIVFHDKQGQPRLFEDHDANPLRQKFFVLWSPPDELEQTDVPQRLSMAAMGVASTYTTEPETTPVSPLRRKSRSGDLEASPPPSTPKVRLRQKRQLQVESSYPVNTDIFERKLAPQVMLWFRDKMGLPKKGKATAPNTPSQPQNGKMLELVAVSSS